MPFLYSLPRSKTYDHNSLRWHNLKYDFKIIAWGAGVGRLLNNDEHYAKEFYITVNREDLKERVLKVLQTVNWVKEYAMTATPNLLQWQVCKYLKEQIPELE